MTWAKRLEHYFANAVIIWVAVLIYRMNGYYTNYLLDKTQTTILVLALTYTIIGFFYYIIVPIEKLKGNKGTTVFNTLIRVFKESFHYLRKFVNEPNHPLPKISKHEKTNLNSTTLLWQIQHPNNMVILE